MRSVGGRTRWSERRPLCKTNTNDHGSREEKKSGRRDISSRESPRGKQSPNRRKIVTKKSKTFRATKIHPLRQTV